MLSAMIEKYLQLFAEAGSRKDTEKCSSLLEQMNQEFRTKPYHRNPARKQIRLLFASILYLGARPL